MRITLVSLIFLFAITVLVVMSAVAEPGGMTPPDASERPVPPREAFTACDGKQAGTQVSFTTPRGETITGICTLIPARLAAVPDHPPQREGNAQPAKSR